MTKNLSYRHDIDGLRAVAVLMVIFNHFGLNVPGGFTGVDIFFVISGFVITNSILPKIVAGNFSFIRFWARRIKRLMPVLYACLLVTLFAFVFILTPYDLIQLSKNTIFANISLSNIFIWKSYGGYFSEGAGIAPLLHTWSLAVEEQFYILWPVLLYAIVKWVPKGKIPFALAGLMFISIYISEFAVNRTISLAYYSMPTRFFEMLAGCICAIYLQKQNFRVSKFNKNLLTIFALGLFVFSAVFITKKTPFPGLFALAPVLFVCLFILNKNSWLNQLLKLKPFLIIGKWSYSLYLWHWPVWVYLVYTDQVNPLNIFLALTLTVILSYLSFTFVEEPFRKKNYKSNRQIFIHLFLIPVFILTVISSLLISLNGLPQRFSSKVIKMDQALNQESKNQCLDRWLNSSRDISPNCVFKKNGNKKSVLLIGDSHASHLSEFIKYFTDKNQYQLSVYTLTTCLPIKNLNYGKNSYYAQKCNSRNEKIIKLVKTQNFDYIVLGGRWSQESFSIINSKGVLETDFLKQSTIVQNKLIETLNYFEQKGVNVKVLEDVPSLAETSPRCPVIKELFKPSKICNAKRTSNIALAKVNARNIINLSSVLCKKHLCKATINDVPLFKDKTHLSKKGALEIAKLYDEVMGDIFLDRP